MNRDKKYWAKEVPEGGHPPSTRVGACPTPLGAPPASWAPWQRSDAHLWLYGVFRGGKKIISKLSRRNSTAMRQNQSRAPRSCSTKENSPQEGEIITNDPLIGRGSISINIFTSTISSQTLVHLLYPIFVPKPQIGTCGLLVVLITPCS